MDAKVNFPISATFIEIRMSCALNRSLSQQNQINARNQSEAANRKIITAMKELQREI